MMVLFNDTPETPTPSSSDERLAALEEKMRNMEEAMISREAEFAETLRRMEAMIGHLVKSGSVSNSRCE